MKVYTHYSKITDTEAFRWRTLLQFGTSWDIIGTAVMMNPGSAAPIDTVTDKETLKMLCEFDDGDTNELWYEFDSDKTMGWVRDLFSEYQEANHHAPLNGVIQIFNLFYIREPKFESAMLKTMQFGSKDLADYDVAHLVAPIYLGFSTLSRHKIYGPIAKRFFDAARDKGMRCYYDDFLRNKFYHPRRLMTFLKNKQEGIFARQQFIQNTTEPDMDIIAYKSDTQKLAEHIWQILEDKKYAVLDSKNHRYRISEQLELTVSTSQSGFIGFRHIGKNHNYLLVSYPNEMQLRNILMNYDYQTDRCKLNVWLGTKKLTEYPLFSGDVKSAAKEIVAEIERIATALTATT